MTETTTGTGLLVELHGTAHRLWPRHRASVPRIRQELVTVLGVCGYGELADTVALLTTELVTNAVLHGRAARGREIGVRYVLAQGVVRVEVSDACDALPVRGASDAVDAECGRGLLLVDALADAWGVEARVHGIGKTVWFELGAGARGRVR